MKAQIIAALDKALAALVDEGCITSAPTALKLDRPAPEHGDFASNVALQLAKQAKMPPRALAEKIIAQLPQEAFEAVAIAGPGFINFRLKATDKSSVITRIFEAGTRYGESDIGQGQKTLIEFVSTNPTGPLHVGHGRGAALGASLANLLETVGYDVTREYYVNDAGRQMHILATSVWLRYLALHDIEIAFPANGYQGDYIQDFALSLQQVHQDKFVQPSTAVLADVPKDEGADGTGDKEAHIDGLIANARSLLGTDYRIFFDYALCEILKDIEADLAEFQVNFDSWYSEQSLYDKKIVDKMIAAFEKQGYMYKSDGNLWFKATAFGDDKDRVVIRANGEPTYFAADIAYHYDKFERGFAQVIDVFGADHHGYTKRLEAAINAMGHGEKDFKTVLVQFAILYEGSERLPMSTRRGQYVTLRDLRQEVGNDACRFFYILRKSDQHMDFDLNLAKSKSNENPLYYIQYAHARICSVLRQLPEKGYVFDAAACTPEVLAQLTEPAEQQLLDQIDAYPEIVAHAAKHLEPHHIAHYLKELAGHLHAYYNAHIFITDDAHQRQARLGLICAVKQVIVNGLTILGVAAPEKM